MTIIMMVVILMMFLLVGWVVDSHPRPGIWVIKLSVIREISVIITIIWLLFDCCQI